MNESKQKGNFVDEKVIDFERDLRLIFLSTLGSNVDASTKSALSEMSAPELVIQYLNWRNRVIGPRPRKIILSQEISKTLTANPQYVEDFEALCRKINVGENLLPHLSDRITTIYQHRPELKPLSGRRDYDLLLNDWGIHHLHLGQDQDPRKRGFLRRGNLLVFGIFVFSEAYLIDIKGHGNFENEELVKITITNWPQNGFFLPLTGALPGTPLTAPERKELRSVGLTTTVDIDGVCYISGASLGVTTTGIPVRLVKQARDFIRAVQRAEVQCLNAAFNIELYNSARLKIGPRSIPRLGSLIDGWGVIDQATDHLLMRIQF